MTNIRNALMQAAGSASGDPVYVEDVFSNTLYVGNGSGTLNTITTGVDLADKGGAVWIKGRDMGTGNHALYDSERGDASSNHSYKWLVPNENYEENNGSANLYQLHSLTSTGFKVQYTNTLNESGRNFVSWSFAKQEGFFDIQTASLDGSGNAQFTHDLGAAPGMVLVKPQNFSDDWYVYHKSTGTGKYLILNTTAAAATFNAWGNVSATTFDANIGFGSPSGKTVVAYFFADGNDSNAQIFGEDSDEAIIKTGTYTGTGNTSLSVNLGFEPQWLLIKASSGGNAGSQYWAIYDVMRGWGNVTGSTKYLAPNLSSAEATWWDLQPTSTGFASTADSGTRANESGTTYIYMAIRRGPMKEPSAGTDVYNYQTRGGGGSGPPAYIFPHPVDWFLQRELGGTDDWYTSSRLIQGKYLKADETDATTNSTFRGIFDFQNGFGDGSGTASAQIAYAWRRYPKVFDVVVGTSDASGNVWNGSHNLGANIELAFVKNLERASTQWWTADLNVGKLLKLNQTDSGASLGTDFTTTTTTFKAFDGYLENSESFVLFAFASLSGISKVGSYTGTGSAINIDCGFSGGARWVMVKRTDAASSDWYIVSSGRGFGKHLKLDSDADESSTAVLDTLSAGFTVRSDAGNDLNANGGTYIYLAFS